MFRKPQETIKYPRTLLLAIHAPYNKTSSIATYYEEFLNLIRTVGIHYIDVMYIKLREINPITFITQGKLHQVKTICIEKNIEHVVISEPLLVQQERNMMDILNVDVTDRTKLILDIFEKAAITSEGKVQVEIAQLEYEKTRLAGKGVFLEQQKGVIGLRGGAGEKLKEREVRYINERIKKYKKQLEKIKKSRDIQRQRRIEQQVPHICLIGYTNAGKSTILNLLTKSNVLAEDKLFATLDTTTRELYIDSKKIGIISDTVGFIQLLPPHLIEAFKSTLSELEYAHLLLHVIDVSDPNWENHIIIVHNILSDLEIEKEMLYVFNKADKIELTEQLEEKLDKYQPYVVISALKKDSLKNLLHFFKNWQPS